MASQPPNAPQPNGPVERAAKLATNLFKLAGGLLGFYEALGQARPSVLLFATAIYLGAQATEDLILKVLERTWPK
jgi:hypothetical protein